jgi:hypothetical protein
MTDKIALIEDSISPVYVFSIHDVVVGFWRVGINLHPPIPRPEKGE